MTRRKTSRTSALRPNIDQALAIRFKKLLRQYEDLALTDEQLEAFEMAFGLLSAKQDLAAEQLKKIGDAPFADVWKRLSYWISNPSNRDNPRGLSELARKLERQLHLGLNRSEQGQRARDDIVFECSRNVQDVVQFQRSDPRLTDLLVLILQMRLNKYKADDLEESLYTLTDVMEGPRQQVDAMMQREHALARMRLFTDRTEESPQDLYKILSDALPAAKLLHDSVIKKIKRIVGEEVMRANRSAGSGSE